MEEFKGRHLETLLVIDWYATWCGPCQKIAPAFRALADKYPNV